MTLVYPAEINEKISLEGHNLSQDGIVPQINVHYHSQNPDL